jgi:catechol 2,3-dioxygenase-like lactoylglutathione lyase family enzyme
MAPPSKFAHVVFNTHRYEEMIDWYRRVFEARVQHRDDRLAFLTYDDEHHRFAFVNLGPAPGPLPPRSRHDVGVNHLAYTWRTLRELVDLYRRLKAQGILPVRPIRHGPTLSLYYADPDGNHLEFQIDVLAPEAADAFMQGPAFEANPIGESFDPDALAARVEAGAAVDDLVFRSDQTPGPLPAVPGVAARG